MVRMSRVRLSVDAPPSPPGSRQHRAGGFLSLCHGRIAGSRGDARRRQVESIYWVCLRRIQISGSDPPSFQSTLLQLAHIRRKTREYDRLNLCNSSDSLPRDSQITLSCQLITPNLRPQTFRILKSSPVEASQRELTRAILKIYRMQLNEGGHQCGKETRCISHSFRSVERGLALSLSVPMHDRPFTSSKHTAIIVASGGRPWNEGNIDGLG